MAVDTLVHGEPEIVFIGSSHIYTGVDPAEFDRSVVNIADSALSYELAEILCSKYWSKVSKAHHVVIELDAVPIYINTLARREGDLREFYEWNLDSAILPLRSLDKTTFAIGEQFVCIRRSRLWPALLQEHNGADDHTRPGFHARHGTLPQGQKDAFFAALGSEFSEEQVVRNLAALERLVQNLLKEGIQPDFYRPPFHSEYWQHPSSTAGQAYVDRAIEMLSEKFSEHRFRTIDYSRLFSGCDETVLFADWTHVSARGATLASRRLSADMTGP